MSADLLHSLVPPMIDHLQQRCSEQPARRPVLALQAPVGAGKSTLAGQLQARAATVGLHLAVASIDDAYHSWSERQRRLAGNPFGVNRVPPGSHDPGLLVAAITSWRAGGPLVLPRFDKTLRQGQGDRSGWQPWPAADALLLEGWLVGYEPVGPAAISRWLADHPHDLDPAERAWLPRWDRALTEYQSLWNCCDSFWMLQPEHDSSVLRWRLQAEARQRRRGGQVLSASEIVALVRASQASLPAGLYSEALEERAVAIARLDGRRRCRQLTLNQSSLSSSLMG
jgi:D-glycerate 3-kinase